MRLLAVDTALGACSVAVLEDGAVRAHRLVPMLRGHAEALAPMVEDAMRAAGIAFSELDRLGVTTGPGTFTGQRVGLAFMRGLRLALRRPLVGVTTLDAMAAAAAAESGLSTVAVLHEAKRGEVYASLVANGETVLPVQVAEFDTMMAAIASAAGAQPVGLAGTAAEMAAARCRERGGEAVLTSIRQPDALWVARLAATAPEPSGAPKPLYLRAPDAKLPQPRLRAADPRDVPIFAGLHALCFAQAWSAQSFHDLLATPGVFGLLAERDGKAIGFALGRAVVDEAELLSIGVREDRRRGGVGRVLLTAMAVRAAEMGAAHLFLEVARDNEAARRLYDRLGFRQVGARSAYYCEGGVAQDAFVLRASLPSQSPAWEIPPNSIRVRSPLAEKRKDDPLTRIEALCVEKGLRMTDQRRVIARVLSDATDHPDAEELYRRASSINPHISIATVYRTVRLFEDAGILERHDFRDGRSRYEEVPDAHHDHLIDVQTGRVIEFRNEEIEKLQKRVAEELGFELVDHRLELYGVPKGAKNGEH